MADERKAPDGYEYQWLPDSAWVIGGNGRKCRMLKCPNEAVAQLMRARNYRAFRRVYPWAYCADHLYGRKIKGGQVLVQTLVEINRNPAKE